MMSVLVIPSDVRNSPQAPQCKARHSALPATNIIDSDSEVLFLDL